VTLNFALSPAQRADLTQLLADQQDPKSSHYHQWLTPEEYGARFGLSDSELSAVSNWVRSQGLTIDAIGRGRSSISMTGSAAQMESAFHVELHNYLVNGETHFANATEPSVPAAVD
jgi:subtilase family serine protease